MKPTFRMLKKAATLRGLSLRRGKWGYGYFLMNVNLHKLRGGNEKSFQWAISQIVDIPHFIWSAHGIKRFDNLDAVITRLTRLNIQNLEDLPLPHYCDAQWAAQSGLTEEVPMIENRFRYYIRHRGKTVWQGYTANDGLVYAALFDIHLDYFEPFEP